MYTWICANGGVTYHFTSLASHRHFSLPDVMASDRCSDCVIGLIDSVQRRHCYGILDFAAKFKGLPSELFCAFVTYLFYFKDEECGKPHLSFG